MNQEQKKPKCNGNCGMNYCDEYGCIENKPEGDVSHLLNKPQEQKPSMTVHEFAKRCWPLIYDNYMNSKESPSKDIHENQYAEELYNMAKIMMDTKEGWIDVKQFEKIVMERLGDKPTIKLLVNANIPFEKWKENVINLIHKELGSKQEMRFSVPAPPQSNTIG